MIKLSAHELVNTQSSFVPTLKLLVPLTNNYIFGCKSCSVRSLAEKKKN